MSHDSIFIPRQRAPRPTTVGTKQVQIPYYLLDHHRVGPTTCSCGGIIGEGESYCSNQGEIDVEVDSLPTERRAD